MRLLYIMTFGAMNDRVANVVTVHDDLLTQWRPISMSKFDANIFLIRTTSNYFWASEVFKNQSFKVTYFPSKENILDWKHEFIFMQLLFYINNITKSLNLNSDFRKLLRPRSCWKYVVRTKKILAPNLLIYIHRPSLC